MFQTYNDDSTLGTKGCDDWYRECLYDHVVPPNHNLEEKINIGF